MLTFCHSRILTRTFLFIHSAPNRLGGESSPRTGQFIVALPQQVISLRWDAETEDLRAVTDADDAERVRDAVLAFRLDRNLGTYPSAQIEVWSKLTAYISGATLRLVSSTSGRLSSLADELPPGMRDVPTRESVRPVVVTRNAERAQALAEGNDAVTNAAAAMPSFEGWVASMKPRFSDVPQRLVPANCSAAERTFHMLDKSFALDSFIEQRFGGDVTGLLGELQYSFVVFLVGQSFAGFEQWRKLVILICSSRTAVLQRPGFYYEFVATLHVQLDNAPTEFFDDPLVGNNFLVPMVAQLLENVLDVGDAVSSDPPMFVKLHRRVRLFKDAVEKRFGREFSANDADADEDGPTIVD
jgi:A1 cistron-splicing factor AAR2